MKNLWYSILCVIVLGCNYNTNLDNEEDKLCDENLQESAVLSRSLGYEEQIILKKEEFCRKFNLAKGNVLSAISEGYLNYMDHGGCGEKCYKEDWYDALFKIYGKLHYSSRSKILLETMLQMGDKRELDVSGCDEYMKPEWDEFDKYAMEARYMLVAAASEAVAVAGERVCNKEEKEDPGWGGVQEPSHEIPDIMSDYEWAEMHGIDWLLDKVGGDVKRLYAERNSRMYALMLSYAFNLSKPIDIAQADRQDKFCYILGGDGLYYIDDYGCLGNYVQRVYGEPYVVKDLESNQYRHGLMLGIDTRGKICFADIWNGSRFVVKGHPTMSKYYYWPVEEPVTH